MEYTDGAGDSERIDASVVAVPFRVLGLKTIEDASDIASVLSSRSTSSISGLDGGGIEVDIMKGGELSTGYRSKAIGRVTVRLDRRRACMDHYSNLGVLICISRKVYRARFASADGGDRQRPNTCPISATTPFLSVVPPTTSAPPNKPLSGFGPWYIALFATHPVSLVMTVRTEGRFRESFSCLIWAS